MSAQERYICPVAASCCRAGTCLPGAGPGRGTVPFVRSSSQSKTRNLAAENAKNAKSREKNREKIGHFFAMSAFFAVNSGTPVEAHELHESHALETQSPRPAAGEAAWSRLPALPPCFPSQISGKPRRNSVPSCLCGFSPSSLGGGETHSCNSCDSWANHLFSRHFAYFAGKKSPCSPCNPCSICLAAPNHVKRTLRSNNSQNRRSNDQRTTQTTRNRKLRISCGCAVAREGPCADQRPNPNPRRPKPPPLSWLGCVFPPGRWPCCWRC